MNFQRSVLKRLFGDDLKIAYPLIMLTAMISTGCSIEKRHYTGGFHIERWSHNQKSAQEIKPAESDLVSVQSSIEDTAVVSTNYVSSEGQSVTTEIEVFKSPSENLNQHGGKKLTKPLVNNLSGFVREVLSASVTSQRLNPEITSDSQKRGSSIHPDAFTSFLCGLAALGCLFAVFITGASPLALFLGLLLAMLFFAFLAGRLSNRAFRDMRYARDRYSGKALAIAGMVMGVLSIVAFIGLILIVLLGFAFINLT